MSSAAGWLLNELIKRGDGDDPDSDEPEAGQKEIFTSRSLLILIMLLIVALFASYILQTRKIQAVHETVLSIFAGMVVGLTLRLTAAEFVLGTVTFSDQFFFNLLLPPIILASGYELHQSNFFRYIGSILTFAFAGTFISAIVLGVILWLWTRIPLEDTRISFVEAMSIGATLSATDPVTILAIFNTYKVDPQLYTVIFGESILNDAVAIVLFETAQKYKDREDGKTMTLFTLFESIGIFLLIFFGSLFIGLAVGAGTSLLLKFTHVRRFPKTESCLIILIAYASYFFSNAIHMSGIVSLLFCGICLKHYAYHNMSRRTQLTTKFIFQVMAQLSENFIFIYLGLSLFTASTLNYKPLFIGITTIGICIARWCSVFPLSRLINSVHKYRARKNGQEVQDEIPWPHQAMLFWAGLRGAVGVALAAGLTGQYGHTLRATVLVVVVLTVIIFGGTTSRMLEILGIRTGVVEEIDSDDEFDIEVVPGGGGTYTRNAGSGFGHVPRPNGSTVPLSSIERRYSNATHNSGTPPLRPHGNMPLRRNSSRARVDGADQNLLSPGDSGSNDEDENDLDLPPAARKTPGRVSSPLRQAQPTPYPTSGTAQNRQPAEHSRLATATGAISQLFTGLSEDPANAFRQLDEGFIKPTLLLDPNKGSGPGPGPGNV